ncbi:MAG: hypothetical protein IJY36_05580 [Coprobacter sp.]|nr:hypothetical protein [Coprobacter sp.]
MAQKQNTPDELDKVNEVLSTSEQFIEKNQKRISVVLLVIILVVAAWLGVSHFYFEPREKAAYAEMFKGEFYLDTDSFEIALNGNGADYIGFKAIIDDYSCTDAANLANAYAGICAYNLGNNNEALNYFKAFSADDKFVSPNVLGMIGNCYANMDQLNEALATFEKAAQKADNILLSPYYLQKAATIAEAAGNYAKALALYNQIKDDYATSSIARDIDKYIERAQAKI